MKKNHAIGILLIITAAIFSSEMVSAYWIWTPGSKKFINPKYAVKDSPKEQYDWAMSFYAAGDYQRAAAEFEKLVKNYEFSEYASKSQYYAGLCYESMGKYYLAFGRYQKAVDNFPHIENLDEILEREFTIANIYATKRSPRLMGNDIITGADRAIEIYRKVIDNAPYGKHADEALFRLGQVLKKSERYDEAIQEFQRLTDEYPSSKFYDKAKYEVAWCAYKASLKPDYAGEPTDKAIKAFEDVAASNKDETLSHEAEKTVQRLKDKAAMKSLATAQFYERQKQYPSAVVYYREVADKFPTSSFVSQAKAKIEELEKKVKP